MYRPLGVTESLFAEFTVSGAMLVVNAASIKGKIDTGLIPQIQGLLQQRHPLLNVSLSKTALQWNWIEASGEPLVEVLEADIKPAEFEQQLGEIMQLQCNTPLKLGGALWRVSVLNGAEQSALIISIHHSICDGLSAAALLGEWIQRYNQLKQDVCASPSRFAIREGLHASLNPPDFSVDDSPFCVPISTKDALAWLNAPLESEPLVEAINCLELCYFSQRQTQQLLVLCRQRGFSLNIVLYSVALGVALALAEYPPSHLSAGGNANVRPLVEPPVTEQELACFVSMFSFTVDADLSDNVWQRAAKVKAGYQQKVASGLHLASCNDDWWKAQPPRRLGDDFAQCQGRFNAIHLSNLGNISHLFNLTEGDLTLRHYYFTAAQHVVGSIFWLGAQTVNDQLSITLNCVAPGVSASMRRRFIDSFRHELLALLSDSRAD
ncbi:condensation domain-containing protein [Agarivorans sp. TSD2052]|uniref:phthiocerol/phthiodiolone dimycocerosyl transferase family protein n=1 Tax=Agarivorans sp. TSD2052 TaxID=2937286 RepID=UPI0020106AF7|nr:condensation domain-containing protein [Agarivorans sp. TSD2052]UPW18956.1 condensation domain-containing protein [Agarivorans sp. TSD2052]